MSEKSDRPGPIPEVSVGLPVYNGEPYLTEALESICAQTFADFELIISDNASTDRTAEICAELASRDPRIRYVRQPRNTGAMRNFDFVATAARGRFFKWASANDRCHSQMLAKSVDVLRREETAVLCYGRTCLVDERGQETGLYGGDFPFLHVRPSDRFFELRNKMGLNNAQSGLIRMNTLRQARLGRLYPGCDLVTMAELALRGTFVLLPEVLLYRRMATGAASRFLSRPDFQAFLDPDSDSLGLSTWRQNWDCCWSVLRAPISWDEKLRALAFAARGLCWERRKLWLELFDRP